jgi:hypothetical protein
MGGVWEGLKAVTLTDEDLTRPLPLGPPGQVLHGVLANGIR